MRLAPATSGWPLTGRDAELHLLTKALTTGDDESVGAVILGPAGVGKSRLAAEAASAASAAGATVRWVAGTESTQAIPLAAFAAWTTKLEGNPIQVVSDIIDALTTVPPDGGQVVVVVDDAHHLDPLSAFVVHQLVLRRTAQVVVTIRSGTQVPDPVTALWKDRRLLLLELQPLSRRESEMLLEGGLDGSVDPECARRMWELTRGNVLYLRHLVDQERAAGRLAANEGVWRWSGAPAATASLMSLIESHIGSVPDRLLDVVDLVAVSEPVDLTLLATLVDGTAIEEAELRGLITVTPKGRASVRIGHPLYGEMRRSQAGRWRMQRLRGRVAKALVDLPDPDIDTAVRAGVMWAESDLPPNPELSLQAARAAFQRLDLPLVERLAEPAKQDGCVEASILCAYAFNLMSRADEAEAIFASLDLAALDEAQSCSVTTVRAANCLWPMAEPEMSWKLIDDALSQNPTDPSMHHTLHAVRSVQLASAARPREAVEAAQPVDLEPLPAVAALVAVWALVIALGDLGAISEATRVAAEGYARAATSLEATYPGVGLADHHVTALLLAGRVQEAEATAAETRRRCADMPGIASTVATAINGLAALGRGDLQAAKAEMTAAKAIFGQLGEPSTLCYRFSIVTVEMFARLGDLHAATAESAAMMRLKHPSFSYLEPDRLLATAWLAAARGAVSPAIAAARTAAAYARDHDQYAREVLCLQTATQFGDKRSTTRLLELRDVVEGPRVNAAATFAVGLAEGNGDLLCEASNQLQEMGDLLAAADASAHAALAYRNRGLRGSALTAAGHAQRLARDAGGARSPALREAAQPLPLTAREREVIALVAQGLSNRQIANVLGISVRTIEGHLHRASSRVGVSSREQLATLLQEFDGG